MTETKQPTGNVFVERVRPEMASNPDWMYDVLKGKKITVSVDESSAARLTLGNLDRKAEAKLADNDEGFVTLMGEVVTASGHRFHALLDFCANDSMEHYGAHVYSLYEEDGQLVYGSFTVGHGEDTRDFDVWEEAMKEAVPGFAFFPFRYKYRDTHYRDGDHHVEKSGWSTPPPESVLNEALEKAAAEAIGITHDPKEEEMTDENTTTNNPTEKAVEVEAAPEGSEKWEIIVSIPGDDEVEPKEWDRLGGKLKDAKAVAESLFNDADGPFRVEVKDIATGKRKKIFERLPEVAPLDDAPAAASAADDNETQNLVSDSTIKFAADSALKKRKIVQADYELVITREMKLDEAIRRLKDGDVNPDPAPKSNTTASASDETNESESGAPAKTGKSEATFYPPNRKSIGYRGAPASGMMKKKHNLAVGLKDGEIAMVNAFYMSQNLLVEIALSEDQGYPLDEVTLSGRWTPEDKTITLSVMGSDEVVDYLKAIYPADVVTYKGEAAEKKAAEKKAKAEAKAQEKAAKKAEAEAAAVADEVAAAETDEVEEITVEAVEKTA